MQFEKKTTLYISGLNYRLEEGDLEKLFSRFGGLQKVHLVPNDKGTKKGIAFVQMCKDEHIPKAIQFLNGKVVAGRTLKVSVAKDRYAKTERPTKFAEFEDQNEERPRSHSPRKTKAVTGLDFMRENLARYRSTKKGVRV